MGVGKTILKKQVIMRNVAGMLIYWNHKVLLVKQKDVETYSIPKGAVENNETFLETAKRETEEETGIIIPEHYINKHRYIASCYCNRCRRKLFYYKAFLPSSFNAEICIQDNSEITDAGFYDIETALNIIQISQIGILWDGGDKLNRKITDLLVRYGWVTCSRHPSSKLLIYDYTDKCKDERFWNEVTFWCRGLITDYEGNIIARPLKKFFEFSQLFYECQPNATKFLVSDKIDGFLGIMYWIDGIPYLATRDSFTSIPAIRGTSILYKKYSNHINNLNPSYTYLFEIVYPNNSLILNYGDVEDLFLIDILDHNGKSMINTMDNIPFTCIKHYENDSNLEHYMSENINGREGYVIKFPDGERMKIKFPWFKKEFLHKNENIK